MARVWKRPGALDPTVPRSKGNFLIRVRETGLVAAKWPRKRPSQNKPANVYQQEEFGLVAQWASNPEPINYQSAINISKGSTQVPRDFLMMASYGTYYSFGPIDGVQPVSYRVVAPNAQLILDQVTDTVGSLLWRHQTGWLGLDPGNNSFVLTMSNGVPMWLPSAGGGGGGAQVTTYDTTGAHTYNVPANVTFIDYVLIAGGGGGGSGRRTASATAASGGAGGGGGAISSGRLRVADLPASLSLSVGVGGAGGAAITVDSTNGNPGASGNNTTLTYGSNVITAGAGSGGTAGSTSSAPATAGGLQGNGLGGQGGSSSVGANGTNGVANPGYGSCGGGGGGGAPAAAVGRHGGTGGIWASQTGWPGNGAAGGNATTLTPPVAGQKFGLTLGAAGGGGGGYHAASGAASDGADGGPSGGGGGGGGASWNGNNSGKGGNGKQGLAILIAF